MGSAGFLGGWRTGSSPQPSLFSQVNHTVALSTIGESNYHFGVTYVGTKQLSPTEVRYLLPFIHCIFLLTNNVASQWKKALSVGDWAAGGVGRWEQGLSRVHRDLGHSFILTPTSRGESEDTRVTKQ